MERPGADFQALIEALQTASADPYATLEEQLASLELSLVAAELNPNPIPLVELTYSLKALSELNAGGRVQARGTAELGVFFRA
jgi:hypothetical protein